MLLSRVGDFTMRRRPLAELWAWLIGLVMPLGGLATALALTLGDAVPASGSGATAAPVPASEVAGVRAGGASAGAAGAITRAPSATPRDSLSTAFAPRGDVAGVQDLSAAPGSVPQAAPSQSAVPPPQTASLGAGASALLAGAPLLGHVGAPAAPAALPAAGLAFLLAGFVLRGHTSARWTSSSSPSRFALSTRRPSRSSSFSFRRT